MCDTFSNCPDAPLEGNHERCCCGIGWMAEHADAPSDIVAISKLNGDFRR